MSDIVKVDREAVALARKKFFKGVPDDDFKLTMLVAQKYGLDPLLKHLVLIPARGGHQVYATRDGLLHIAHSSGKPWSMTFKEPQVKVNPYSGKEDVYLEGTVTVHDPDTNTEQTFTAGLWLSEYDAGTGAWKSHKAAMHMKVVEVYLLRRAFDVSLTPFEEVERVYPAAGEPAQAGQPAPARQPSQPARSEAALPEPPAQQEPRITGDQAAKTGAGMKERGFDGSEKAKTLAATVVEHIVGHPVANLKELTKAEATMVLSHLNSFKRYAEGAGVGDSEGYRDVMSVLVGKGGKLNSKKDVEEALDDLLSSPPMGE